MTFPESPERKPGAGRARGTRAPRAQHGACAKKGRGERFARRKVWSLTRTTWRHDVPLLRLPLRHTPAAVWQPGFEGGEGGGRIFPSREGKEVGGIQK